MSKLHRMDLEYEDEDTRIYGCDECGRRVMQKRGEWRIVRSGSVGNCHAGDNSGLKQLWHNFIDKLLGGD